MGFKRRREAPNVGQSVTATTAKKKKISIRKLSHINERKLA